MVSTPALIEIVSQYTISVLPSSHPEFRKWAVTLDRLDYNLWRVRHCGYAFDGRQWLPDSSEVPSFELKDAYRHAQEQAPLVQRNGLTAAEYLARCTERASNTTAEKA